MVVIAKTSGPNYARDLLTSTRPVQVRR